MIILSILLFLSAYIIGYACVFHFLNECGFSKKFCIVSSLGSWASAFIITIIAAGYSTIQSFKL